MQSFRDILLAHEALLLFLVIGLGYLVGQIKIRGFGFGGAGVLFVGIAFGAWQPKEATAFHIAPLVTETGLILFVYAIGLTSGPGFFSSLRERGIRFNIAIIVALAIGAVSALIAGKWWLHLSPGLISGVFCGGLTNTPALAAATEYLKAAEPTAISEPALGYSVAYPFGILGFLISFQTFTWIFRKRFQQEREQALSASTGEKQLIVRNFEIRNPKIFGRAIGELKVQDVTGVIISRHRHEGVVAIPTKYTILHEGDVVVVVGNKAAIDKALEFFGAESKERLDTDREHIDMRRILVSNRSLVGKTIKELELDRRFNAQITRLRRADFDMIPSQDTVLELGDRLRVVMPTDKVAEVSKFFGDSLRSIAELDYTAITLGISLGVLVGLIPIPLPGGSKVTLGIAGGPLVVALVLGKLGRTGRVVWSIPHEANEAIRHIGLLFFLAGVGVMAGGKFLQAIQTSGIQLLILGILTTMITTGLSLAMLHFYAKSSIIGTLGATSGMQTQPASLARAREMSGSDETYVTYAITYPVAMIGKILLAQLLILAARLL